MTVAIIVIVAVVLAITLALVRVVARRRPVDGVESFRRHIDALGPEARRTTVDQVQSAAARNAGDDDAVDPTGDESATEKPSSTDDTPEDGARGT